MEVRRSDILNVIYLTSGKNAEESTGLIPEHSPRTKCQPGTLLLFSSPQHFRLEFSAI